MAVSHTLYSGPDGHSRVWTYNKMMNSRSSIRATLSSDRPKATLPRTSGSVVCCDRRAMSAWVERKMAVDNWVWCSRWGSGRMALVPVVGWAFFESKWGGAARFPASSLLPKYRLRADGPGKAANQCCRHTTCG
jgi:hypothetical protein